MSLRKAISKEFRGDLKAVLQVGDNKILSLLSDKNTLCKRQSERNDSRSKVRGRVCVSLLF